MENLIIKGDISNITLEEIKNVLVSPKDDQYALHINSQGGYIDPALDISVLLLGLGTRMISIGYETVASSALLIHQSCLGDRIATPKTRFLLHNIKLPDGHTITEKNLKDEFTIFEFYSKVTGRTLEQVYDLAKQSRYIDVKEALEFGFITKIIDHPFPSY